MATDPDGRPQDTLTLHEHPHGQATARSCEACGHDLAVHDATSTRFCQASLARSDARRCLCTAPDGTRLGPASGSGSPMYGRGRFSPS